MAAASNDMLSSVQLPSVSTLAIACACVLTVTAAPAQEQPDPATGEATFNVFLRSTPAGVERTLVTRTASGWVIQSTGQFFPPIDLKTQRFEAEYDTEWQPLRLAIDSVRAGKTYALETVFSNGTAASIIREGILETTRREPVDAATVVLPNYFFTFAAYEALAVRLHGSQPGDVLPVYVTPSGQIAARVNEVLTRQLETAERTLTVRIYRLVLQNPGQPLEAEVWADDRHRLVRVSFPSISLEVARQDVVQMSTRLTSMRHPGDKDVRIPASGFSLAATVTSPVNHTAPPDGQWPTVLLVPSSGSVDRDETVLGVPIFGQLAGALAEAGYLVARYDKRGVGQSGGRPESATLDDYAADVRDIVRHLDDRNDVDRKRLVVVGHGDGGWVGLLAASKEDKIAALALIAVPSINGHALVLEQQQTELTNLETPEATRQEKVALQERIHAAVRGSGSWENVPADLRRRADTPWFRSFLEFEPAEIMQDVRQPILVLHGELDQKVLPHHGDLLKELALARTSRQSTTVEVVKLAGINHLLVPVTTGGVDERKTLTHKNITPLAVDALTNWIERTLRPDK